MKSSVFLTLAASALAGISLCMSDDLVVDTPDALVFKPDNTSFLTNETKVTGIITTTARQWNSTYTATNVEPTASIAFSYDADTHGRVDNAAISFFTQDDNSGPAVERARITSGGLLIGGKLALTGNSSIFDLADVQLHGTLGNDVLRFNGTAFVNEPLSVANAELPHTISGKIITQSTLNRPLLTLVKNSAPTVDGLLAFNDAEKTVVYGDGSETKSLATSGTTTLSSSSAITPATTDRFHTFLVDLSHDATIQMISGAVPGGKYTFVITRQGTETVTWAPGYIGADDSFSADGHIVVEFVSAGTSLRQVGS